MAPRAMPRPGPMRSASAPPMTPKSSDAPVVAIRSELRPTADLSLVPATTKRLANRRFWATCPENLAE